MIFDDWMEPGRKPEETKEILTNKLASITKKAGGFPNVKLRDIPNSRVDKSIILSRMTKQKNER